VTCQLKALEGCFSPSDLQRALDSLPRTLDDTYAKVLGKIAEEKRDSIALRIFEWLVSSRRPLTIEELAELAIVDFEKEDPVSDRIWDPYDIAKICPLIAFG
jgi:hypothetical protein